MDLSAGLTRLLQFISDMQMVNLNYGDKKPIVNNLIAYLIKCNYTLNTYHIDSSVLNFNFNCDNDNQVNLPPVGFPGTLLNGLHYYSNVVVPNNKNKWIGFQSDDASIKFACFSDKTGTFSCKTYKWGLPK